MTAALIVLAGSAVVFVFMFAALVERVGELGKHANRIAAKLGAPHAATGDDVVEAFQRGHEAGMAQAREELSKVTPIDRGKGPKGKGA